jgi:ATP/maltotriose-dependent transcriptional regulator MalT
LELREVDVAKGCLRRAATLLKDIPAGAQHGHLSWMSARFCVYEGDLPLAMEHAQRAIEIGKQLGSLDLETIGKLYLGVVLQATGETRQGLELQGEAAAAVVSGSVSPLIGGIVYCGLLAGYCNAGELQRAGQWTDSFSRWCERSKLQLFQGSCLLHRAEVFAARGELERAQTEIIDGGELLRISAPWAIGDAQRLLGDLHLAQASSSGQNPPIAAPASTGGILIPATPCCFTIAGNPPQRCVRCGGPPRGNIGSRARNAGIISRTS